MAALFAIGVSPSVCAEPWNIYLPESSTNAKALEPFLDALESGRGAIVMGGDSNQLFNSFGWSDGVELAWTTHFGAYATGLLAVAENSGSGSGAGYLYSSRFTTGSVFEAQDAVEISAGVPHSSFLKPISFGVLAPGVSSSVPTFWGLQIPIETVEESPLFALPSSHDLRAHLTFRAMAQDAGGRFHPTWEASAIAGVDNVLGDPVDVVETPAGFDTVSLDLPYSDATGVLGSGFFRFRLNRNTITSDNVLGPLHMDFYQVERVGAAGVSVSTLAWLGGQGFKEFGEGFDEGREPFDTGDPGSPSAMSIYFSRLRSLMDEPRVLIRLYFGGNDIYSKQRSAAQSELDARASINLIRTFWAQQGWDESELYFLIVGWHHRPIDTSNGMWEHHALIELRQRLATIALQQPRTAYVDMRVLAPGEEMLDEGYWDGSIGGLTAHLSEEGYRVLAQRELDTLLIRNDCVPDLNGDYHVDSQDLGLVLSSWGSADHSMDLTHDGVVNSQDLGRLLSEWGPCPLLDRPRFEQGGGLTPIPDRVRFFPHAEHKRD
ncbi:MAG: hypothetical protein ACF8GE_10730 [Phycisphaerales bacterium JB043]